MTSADRSPLIAYRSQQATPKQQVGGPFVALSDLRRAGQPSRGSISVGWKS
jgi:hypothetical protein